MSHTGRCDLAEPFLNLDAHDETACVFVPGENDDYDYALTAIPAEALRLLYEKFGARLLEANVRSFLSVKGKGVNAGIQNAGQTCSASSRILVQRGVYDQVRDRMAAAYHALKVGPALDDLNLGPLISARQKDIVTGFIAQGADLTVAAQGQIVTDAAGHYVAPVLFADVPPGHVLAQEEIFGPVQVLIPFDDEAEALKIANGTAFGLVASIWTRDGGRQMRLAKALHAGQVFINNYGAGGGVELPFGGVGKSGHGREKGFEALYGFSTLKTVAAWHG